MTATFLYSVQAGRSAFVSPGVFTPKEAYYDLHVSGLASGGFAVGTTIRDGNPINQFRADVDLFRVGGFSNSTRVAVSPPGFNENGSSVPAGVSFAASPLGLSLIQWGATSEFRSTPVPGIYQTSDGIDVSALLLSPDGATRYVAPPVASSSAGDQVNATVAATFVDPGGFLYVWQDSNPALGGGFDVMARAYAVDGTPLGAAFGVADVGSRSGDQIVPDGAALASGGYVVVWQDTAGRDGDGASIRAKLLQHDGAVVGSDIQLNHTVAGDQRAPEVIPLGDGFAALWLTPSAAGGSDTIVRLFDGTGHATGDEIKVNGSATAALGATGDLVPLPSGGFAVAYLERVGTNDQIYLRTFDAGGSADSDPIAVGPPGSILPSLSLMADGRLLVGIVQPATGPNAQGAWVHVFDTRTSGVTVVGTGVHDEYVGTGHHDVLTGEGGSDVILAGGGDDAVSGGAGADFLIAESGHDIVFGGAGDDQIMGQDGDDILWGEDDKGAVAGNDQIDGGAGDDTLVGQGGSDLLVGGAGNDAVSGGSEGDRLYGLEGNDILFGDEGSDLIYGGQGDDVLKGGSGADLFVFGLGEGIDLVLDLNAGGDKDGFDLRTYFAAIGYTGTDPRADGVLALFQNAADTDVYVSGHLLFTLKGVVAAAVDDSYFLFQ